MRKSFNFHDGTTHLSRKDNLLGHEYKVTDTGAIYFWDVYQLRWSPSCLSEEELKLVPIERKYRINQILNRLDSLKVLSKDVKVNDQVNEEFDILPEPPKPFTQDEANEMYMILCKLAYAPNATASMHTQSLAKQAKEFVQGR